MEFCYVFETYLTSPVVYNPILHTKSRPIGTYAWLFDDKNLQSFDLVIFLSCELDSSVNYHVIII